MDKLIIILAIVILYMLCNKSNEGFEAYAIQQALNECTNSDTEDIEQCVKNKTKR